MKGCPLNCLWCHNPEGISPLAETVVSTNRIGSREFHTDEVAGKYYSVESVLEILGKEKVFMSHSKGGVTFSGGEPMLQFDFLLETLKECRAKGYHTAVDTSGYSSPENYRAILPFTDLFLFDIKHLDEARHFETTGVSNTGILENFKLITQSGKDVLVRIPVIPGINDDREYLETLKKFLTDARTNSIKRIDLLPFHKTGASKYKKFNIPYRMKGIEPPDKEKMQKMKAFFEDTGIKVKIGG